MKTDNFKHLKVYPKSTRMTKKILSKVATKTALYF